MCSFVTQHIATDVASFEGVCNLHADCRKVDQSFCLCIRKKKCGMQDQKYVSLKMVFEVKIV